MKKLGAMIAELLPKYSGECTAELRCAFMSAVLEIEKGRRVGFVDAASFSLSTGKANPPRIVYYTRPSQYIQLRACPFCGGRYEGKKEKRS